MRRFLALGLIALLVTGCGAAAATPTPAPQTPAQATVSASVATTATPTSKATPTTAPSPTVSPTPKPTPSPANTPTPTPALAQPVIGSQTIERQAKDKSWTASFKKPVVSGIAATTAKAVNDRIDKFVESSLAAFALDHGDPTPAEPSGLQGTFAIAYASPKLLCLRLTVSIYISGAAHPGGKVTTLDFDLRHGNEITFGDLFADGQAALGILSTQSRQLLVAALGDAYFQDMVDAGTGPDATNFEAFALLPAGLEITFQEYQVAPYAAGVSRIVVPWSVLAAVLNPNGPANLVK